MLAYWRKTWQIGCFLRYTLLTEFIRRSKATIIDGRTIAKTILKNLVIEREEFQLKFGRLPFLTAVLVGNNAASKIYVRNKVKAANIIGIKTHVVNVPDTIQKSELIEKIRELNKNNNVDAILLQLPLPDHICSSVCDEVSPEKDVDGFTSANLGKFYMHFDATIPCTALAVHRILTEIGMDTVGKNALICGRSKHVSLPIAMLLHSSSTEYGFNANTTICHRFTPSEMLTKFCREADIVVTATGIPSLIRGDMVKEGAVVIDVGISRITDFESEKSKIVGDVDFQGVSEIAGFLTPVPGGVGPLTVAMLMQNTLKLAERRMRKQIK